MPNSRIALEGKDPLWIATAPDMVGVSPICVPDNKARGFVSDVRPLTAEEKDGLDMFGLELNRRMPNGTYGGVRGARN